MAINSGAGIDFFVLADDEGRAGWICLMPPAAQKLSSANKGRPEPKTHPSRECAAMIATNGAGIVPEAYTYLTERQFR